MATWMIAHLDCRGVFYADPAVVRSMVLPMRPELSIDQVQVYLDAMCRAGLIEIFKAGGRTWQHWIGFDHNQVGLRVDRESTDFPAPPGAPAPDDAGKLPEESRQVAGKLPEDCRSESGKHPAENKQEQEHQLFELNAKRAAKARLCATFGSLGIRAGDAGEYAGLIVAQSADNAHLMRVESAINKLALDLSENKSARNPAGLMISTLREWGLIPVPAGATRAMS